MTTSHPVTIRRPFELSADFAPRAVGLGFCEPRRNRVARHAKHAREATQGGTLVLSAQYLFFSLLVIAVGLWILAQTALAITVLESLLAVAGFARLMNLVAAAVITNHTSHSDTLSNLKHHLNLKHV
jgi:hypothetical protein